MSDFLDRMKLELDDLDGKIGRLTTFTVTETFSGLPEFEKWLLLEQHEAMMTYHRILSQRIRLYGRKGGTG